MQLILLLLLLFVLFLTLLALSLSLSFFFGPPFVPTPRSVINQALDLSNAGEKDVLIDLGSGDGIVLIEAAKRNILSIGYETNPFLVLWTLFISHIKSLNKKVKVYKKRYQQADIKKATIIFCYNLPKYMPEVSEKLKKELPKNSRIISYKFLIPGLKVTKKTKNGIFLYSLKK